MLAALASPLRTLVVLGVTASVAAAAAPVAWHVAGHAGVLPAPAAAPERAAPAERDPVDIAPVLAFAPFGTAVVPEAEEATGPIGETTLDLTLRGVVWQQAPATSTAFIGHDGETRGYGVGDMVAERAEVMEIAPAQVVLKVAGELQTLSFPDPGGGSSLSAAAVPEPEESPESASAARLEELMATAGEMMRPETTTWEGDGPPETTQEYIDLWRQRIKANPGQVLDTIGLVPDENGYRIAEDHDSGVTRAGLRAGDLVKSVNGHAVGDVQADRQLYDQVTSSGQARIEIERDGRTIVMSFPLQ